MTPTPRRQPSGGRSTASMVGGALLGALLGLLLPATLSAVVLLGAGHPGAATVLTVLGWLVCVPLGVLLGVLAGDRRARRIAADDPAERRARPRPPFDLERRPNRIIQRRNPDR